MGDGIVQYCFDYLDVTSASHAIFEAPYTAQGTPGTVSIVTKTASPAVDPDTYQRQYSVHIGGGSRLYSVPWNVTPDPANPKATATPLTVSIPQGNTGPECTGGSCGVWVQGGGGKLFGSIDAPEGYVRVGENTSVEPVKIKILPDLTIIREEHGYIIGREVWIRPGANVLLNPPGVTPGYSGPGAVRRVTVSAWRRCQNSNCTQ